MINVIILFFEHFLKFAFIVFISYVLALINTSQKAIEIEQMPDKEESAFSLFIFFIVASILFFLLLKYVKLFFLLNIAELMLLFFSSYVISFILLHNLVLSITFSLFLTILRTLNKFSTNITATINSIGGAIIIGSFLPLFPLIIFSLLLIVYDVFSVFISKHMIEMANIAKKYQTAMLIESKREYEERGKKHVQSIIIGTGDIVLPSSIVIASIPFDIHFTMFLSSLIGYWLVVASLFILKRPLPALPFILFPQLLTIFLLSTF